MVGHGAAGWEIYLSEATFNSNGLNKIIFSLYSARWRLERNTAGVIDKIKKINFSNLS